MSSLHPSNESTEAQSFTHPHLGSAVLHYLIEKAHKSALLYNKTHHDVFMCCGYLHPDSSISPIVIPQIHWRRDDLNLRLPLHGVRMSHELFSLARFNDSGQEYVQTLSDPKNDNLAIDIPRVIKVKSLLI